MNSFRSSTIVTGLLILSVLFAACGASNASQPEQVASPTPGKLTKVTLDMGYVPDVQFAPFYLAKERGYFEQAGLDVQFKHGVETNMLTLLGTGKLNYGIASGDEMLTARSKGIPLLYVGAWFQKYPIVVITRKDLGITKISQLKGKSIGIPGPYGASYIGLRALLDSAGMTEKDVNLKSIGYNQVQALQRKQVDAVVGYANNELLQLERLGVKVNTIPVWEHQNLVTNGLVTNEKNLKEHPNQVAAMVHAMLLGVRDTIKDPKVALDASLKYIPEAEKNRDTQLAKLKATIPLWRSEGTKTHGLGYSDPASWKRTSDFLRQAGMLEGDLQLKSAYTNQFVSEKLTVGYARSQVVSQAPDPRLLVGDRKRSWLAHKRSAA